MLTVWKTALGIVRVYVRARARARVCVCVEKDRQNRKTKNITRRETRGERTVVTRRN